MSSGEADSSNADALAARSSGSSASGEGGLGWMPALAMLAASAAVAHAVIYRVVLTLLVSKKLPLPTVLLWSAPFSLNLAATAGLIALSASTLDVVRASWLSDASRRLLIAFLSCIIVSTVAFATFLPAPRVNPQQVLVAAGALHTMNVQLALMVMRATSSLACRTTVGLLAVSALFPLLSLVMSQLPGAQGLIEVGNAGLHGLGELAYLFVPLSAAFVVVPWEDAEGGRKARKAGAFAAAMMALAFAAATRLPDAVYGHILYSTLRLEWALDRASVGYAVPVSLAAGAATAALVSRDPRHRQGGTGLWLWLAGGYNPLTPARILLTALAAMLLSRAALSIAAAQEAADKQDR